MSASPTSARELDPVDEGVDVLAIVNRVLRRRRLILLLALTIGLLLGALSYMAHPKFTANGAVLPQARRTTSAGLSGLAAQFGVAIPGSDASQSPQFYADIMKSHVLLGAIVDSMHAVVTDSGAVRATLPVLFGMTKGTPAQRREDAITQLGTMITVAPQAKTGVVRFSVRAPFADLAYDLAGQLLRELNRFNVSARAAQASAERDFAERRAIEAKGELSQAEDRLRAFLQGNRSVSAPGLSLEQERLQREITLRQQLYTSLSQAFEQARLEEVRDTPVIAVLEPPYLPVRRDPRGTVGRILLGVVLGGFVGLVLAFLSRAPSGDSRVEFDGLWAETLRDLRRPWRLFQRAA